MAYYTGLVYDLVSEGQPYTRPEIPSSFVSLYGVPTTWNPYSTDAANRTEYWEDVSGVLTLDQVQLAIYGLTAIKQQQITLLNASYLAVISANFDFTGSDTIMRTYNASPLQIQRLAYAILGCLKDAAVPSGFYWESLDSTHVLLTYDDLLGLAKAVFTRNSAAFNYLNEKIEDVMAATTVLGVKAITW